MSLAAELEALRAEVRTLAARTRSPINPAVRVIAQATHGFTVGQLVRHNGSSWVTSKADTAANAVIGGMVIGVLGTGVFVLGTPGLYVTGLTSRTAGTLYYLDASTAGALTATAPTIARPCLLADSTTSGVLLACSTGDPPAAPTFGYLRNTYTSSGTWTAAAGVRQTTLVLVSKGGNSVAGATCGGGGGGGVLVLTIDCTVLTSIDYTIGTADCRIFTGGGEIIVYSGAPGGTVLGGYGGYVKGSTSACPTGVIGMQMLTGTHGAIGISGAINYGGVPGWSESTLVSGTTAGTAREGRGYGAYGGSGARTADGGCLLEYYN
jgi:hypothetical protein